MSIDKQISGVVSAVTFHSIIIFFQVYNGIKYFLMSKTDKDFSSIFSESDELTHLLNLIETPHELASDKESKDAVSIKAKQWPTGCTVCSQLQAAEAEKLEKFRYYNVVVLYLQVIFCHYLFHYYFLIPKDHVYYY